MKKALNPYNPIDIQRTHPLSDMLEGWFFRCDEVSAGYYEAEGKDLWGRTVAANGVNPDELLKRCIADAKAINSETTSNNIRITLARPEALVLFEFLSRFSDCQKLTIEHEAERRVLWDLCASLESFLSEPLDKEYQAILQTARDSVLTEE